MIERLVPATFEVLRREGSVLAIRRDSGDRLRELALARPAERSAQEGRAYEGRGPTQRVTYDTAARARAVFRRYRHGGLLRWLTRDRLFDPLRPFRELEVVETAREGGVPTAEVLAVRVDRVGPFLYAGEMVTREVENAPDLIHWLAEPGRMRPSARRAAGRALGRAVARMHFAGVLHSDLHLKNLLVRSGDPPEAFVIDLDKASRHPPGSLGLEALLANLQRLDRSVAKFNYLASGGISRTDRLRFLEGYALTLRNGLTAREAMRRLGGRRYRLRRLKWFFLRLRRDRRAAPPAGRPRPDRDELRTSSG